MADPVVKSNVTLIARLLSVASITSLDAITLSWGRCSSDFIISLDKSPNRESEVQCLFSLSFVQVEKLTDDEQTQFQCYGEY